MALLGSGVRSASVLTAGKCELIKIPAEEFLKLCRNYPQIEEGVRKLIEERKEQAEKVTPEISELLERSGQWGVIQPDALLGMDLDLCISCAEWVMTCKSLHGKGRLIPNAVQFHMPLPPHP